MKTTKLILAAIFIMALSFGLKAQEKYEYATVVCRFWSNTKAFISISKEGKFEQTEVKVAEGVIGENYTGIIEVVNKMNNEGWEVYSNSTGSSVNGSNGVMYYLRKKKG